MEIYNILIGILLFFCLLSVIKPKNNLILIITTVALICIASLKSISVGTDSWNYFNYFTRIDELYDEPVFIGVQRGWYFFNRFFHDLFNYDIFLFACYGIMIAGFSSYIAKNSKNYAFSMLLFVLMYFFCSSLNIMRQYIAIGIVYYALNFLEKDVKRYSILVLLASLFHFSALICLLFIFLPKLNITKSWIPVIIIVGSYIIGFFFSETLFRFVNILQIFSNSLRDGIGDYFLDWGDSRNLLTNLALNIMLLLTYCFSKDRNNNNIKLYLIFVILNNLFGAAGQGNRIFLYLQLAMIVAIPNTVYDIKNSLIRVGYVIVALVFAFGVWYYSISSNASEVLPYIFR